MFFVFAISYFFPLLSTIILNLEAIVPWLSCLSDISKLMNGKLSNFHFFIWSFVVLLSIVTPAHMRHMHVDKEKTLSLYADALLNWQKTGERHYCAPESGLVQKQSIIVAPNMVQVTFFWCS